MPEQPPSVFVSGPDYFFRVMCISAYFLLYFPLPLKTAKEYDNDREKAKPGIFLK
jgi:hypothetical protein